MEGCVRDVRGEGADGFRAEIMWAGAVQSSPLRFSPTNPSSFTGNRGSGLRLPVLRHVFCMLSVTDQLSISRVCVEVQYHVCTS